MSFLSRLFGKEEKNEVELYMEHRKRESDTNQDGIEEENKPENVPEVTAEISGKEASLLTSSLSEIPEQYYFWKDEKLYLFMDYFHEGIFYSGDIVTDEKMIGLLYSLFHEPEKTVEIWYQNFLEKKKEARRNDTEKALIIDDIDEVLRTVCAFGLQGCDKYILPIAKKREILDYWFQTKKIYYSGMLQFVEKLFFLEEGELATELLVKLLGKKNFDQNELREEFLDIYCKMRRMIPKQVEQMKEPLQHSLLQAGYKEFAEQLRQKDQEIFPNPYVNVYELAEKFFEDPQGTLETWLEILRAHEAEMKEELQRMPYPEEDTIGKQLTEYVLEAIGTIGRYRFAGVPKCLGENEEWCHFLIYSSCEDNLSEYLATMFDSNHVELVERILELLKPIGSRVESNWNYFCTMWGTYSWRMFEKWDMPESEDDFLKVADDFTDRWLV